MDERHWRLLVRLFSGEASPDEREEVRRWMGEDPARAAEVDSLRALWNASGSLPQHGDVDAAWSRVAQRTRLRETAPAAVRSIDSHPARSTTPPTMRGAAWRGPVLRIAAVLVVVLGAALLWKPAGEILRNERTVVTGKGERVQLVLSDGSRVLLGVDSRLRFPRRFRGAARDVRLEGAAYFEVARDEGRPFTVYTADAVTRVLGTKFTVRDYAGAEPARVVVTEGKVAVRPASAPEGRPAAVLVKGEAAELSTAGPPKVVERPSERQDLAWTQGTIAFRNAPVPQVLAEIARWYEVEIEVRDPALAARHLTISFRHEPLDTLLEEIAAVLGARVERRGNVFILTPAQPVRSEAPAREARGASL